MDYKSTWAATVTQANSSRQRITVYWTDRAPATYPAAILADILSDHAGQAAQIIDAETGELIFSPESGYVETLANIDGEPALIIGDDESRTCYTWTPYHGIRAHSNYSEAAAYMDRRGWWF